MILEIEIISGFNEFGPSFRLYKHQYLNAQ